MILLSGMPPWETSSRYVSVQPSSMFIALRCGGWSSATRHYSQMTLTRESSLRNCKVTHSAETNLAVTPFLSARPLILSDEPQDVGYASIKS